jgi:hypothetical protein
MEDMTYEMENTEATDLVACENDVVDEDEGIDVAKILKVLVGVGAAAGVVAFASRKKIRKWKKKQELKKLEKLAAKHGISLYSGDDVIECEYEEVDDTEESDD